jgi:hypothetical protein
LAPRHDTVVQFYSRAGLEFGSFNVLDWNRLHRGGLEELAVEVSHPNGLVAPASRCEPERAGDAEDRMLRTVEPCQKISDREAPAR